MESSRIQIQQFAQPYIALPPPIPQQDRVRHIALIGNHAPRRCGIATYTTDVADALADRYPGIRVDIWAMNEPGKTHAYPDRVTGEIEQNERASYLEAAREITASGADMVWIQHEFGIFGGAAGDHILTLIDRMTVPVAVAMHTVLAKPDRDQRRVTLALVERCETIIVMADEARRILLQTYHADPEQVLVIPHGIPDRPFSTTDAMKAQLGFEGREVILTFGLLSPGKGIETMIAAMPAIVARHPQALYLVLGATHPHYVDANGENYRDALVRQADELGVSDNVQFINRFAETDELLDFLTAADIYVTPYLNPAQVTSGTLSYAVGLGKPVVSTPYIHARELLDSGHGRLVGFGDSAGFATTIDALLSDPVSRLALGRRAYARARTMIWPRLAERSLARFEAVALRARKAQPLRQPVIPAVLGLAAIERMSDSTGMYQHSVLGVPDRRHGYCIDDNARALILACRDPRLAVWLPTYAAFVDHGWNPDTERFRNFMRFDRSWCESVGSEDSCGRTVWALGIAAHEAPVPAIRQWAEGLYSRTIESLRDIHSPRAIAFMMLGTVPFAVEGTNAPEITERLTRWGEALLALHAGHVRSDWEWFEPVLAYDNARLCEALIRTGTALGREDFVATGLSTLDWLTRQQTTSDAHFRAIGADSFCRPYAKPLPFDQQPVEAWAQVDAALAAYEMTGDERWLEAARNACLWFLGKNELGLALGSVETGECFDGLIPTGVNRNCGAESILAFHLAMLALNKVAQTPC
jgi:glycosyltransferase involved in cell wall biosynthesis